MKRVALLVMGLMLAVSTSGCIFPGYHDPCSGYMHSGSICRFQPFRYLREMKEAHKYHKALKHCDCGHCGKHKHKNWTRQMQSVYHVGPTQPFSPMGQCCNSGCNSGCGSNGYGMMQGSMDGVIYEGTVMGPEVIESGPTTVTPMPVPASPQPLSVPPAQPMPKEAAPSSSPNPVPAPPSAQSSSTVTPPIHQELAPLPLNDARMKDWRATQR